MNGIECLPNLKKLTINLYQSPLLLDNMYMSSPLEVVIIKTYCINQLLSLYGVCDALDKLIMEHYDSCTIQSAIIEIATFTEEVFDCENPGRENLSITVGIRSLTEHLNIGLGVFYRRVVDAFNYAVQFWNEEMSKDDYEKYGMRVKKDYDMLLMEKYRAWNMSPVSAENSEYNLQCFFEQICDLMKKCITHGSKEMEDLLSKRIGKKLRFTIFTQMGK